MMDAARKRAQRRAIYLAKRRGDPQQSIQAVGSRCRIHRDDALYQATEDQQGLYGFQFSPDFVFNNSRLSRPQIILFMPVLRNWIGFVYLD